MRSRTISALAAGLVLLAACGDDPAGPDTRFDLTVRAVDHEGLPVAGLELLVIMDSPYYQDGRAAAKAAVAIEFVVPLVSHTTVTIEDVAGRHARTLIDDVLAAGVHRVQWDGRDDDGVHLYSGLYYARMIGRDQSGAVAYDRRQPMYMGLLDFGRATLGTTDDRGEIVLKDRRLFPALYGEVDMQSLDESGEAQGDFPLTHTMRFYLRDPRYGHVERFDRDVLPPTTSIVLDWMGVDAGEPAAAARPGGVKAAEPPETGFYLGAPYPNPFN